MQQRFGDLPHARQHDAGALFYCQRMISGLQLDEGPLTDGLGVDVGLQGERGRLVQRQFGGQPTEVRLLPFPSGGGPQRQGAGEVVAAQRHPDSPVELGARGGVGDRDDEASPDEEMLGLDNALLLFERARLVTSERRVPVGRGICPVRHRQAAVAFTAAPALIADLTGHRARLPPWKGAPGRFARSAPCSPATEIDESSGWPQASTALILPAQNAQLCAATGNPETNAETAPDERPVRSVCRR